MPLVIRRRHPKHAQVLALASLLVMSCCQASLYTAQGSYLRDIAGQQVLASTAGTTEFQAGTGTTNLRRRLLDTIPSQLAQNVTYSYSHGDGYFYETFVHFASSDLKNYTLLPVNGSCSTNATLPANVMQCAAEHQKCCHDGSTDQVRCE